MINKNKDTIHIDTEAILHRHIIWSLVMASSVAWIPSLLAGILLIDIANTFGYPIGVAGQIFTVARIVGVISALLLGVLTVRFRSKTMLIVGLLAFVVFSIGCSLAPSFNTMLISYSFSGLGMAVVMPMSMSLVGEHLPMKKRANAIGLISASTSVPGLIVGPLIGLIVGYGGWRLSFIVFTLPLSLLGLIAVSMWLPSGATSHESEGSNVDFFEGFKEIIFNRSAFSSLLGYVLALASMTALGAYCPSFLRENFLVSTEFVSNVFALVNIVYSLGSIACGRIVGKFGRKLVLIVSLLLESILIILSTNVQNLWVALIIIYLAYLMMGLVFPVSMSLTLEQVPKFRGTMMSLNSAAGNLGMALGSAVGGLILLMYSYGFVGVSLGVLGIIGTIIYQTQVVDPT
jgi:DHA1 family purine base/nucleoside efflux pump-like MFS transporter